MAILNKGILSMRRVGKSASEPAGREPASFCF